MPNDTLNETSLLYDYEGNLVEEIESEDPMESDAEDSIFMMKRATFSKAKMRKKRNRKKIKT